MHEADFTPDGLLTLNDMLVMLVMCLNVQETVIWRRSA